MPARPILWTDLAVGDGIMAGMPVKVCVPVLMHAEAGMVWASPEVFPMSLEFLPDASKVFERVYAAAVIEWPEMAGDTDWHAWKFPEERPV